MTVKEKLNNSLITLNNSMRSRGATLPCARFNGIQIVNDISVPQQ